MMFNLITILGPTAVGKTRFAAKLADKFDGEIISADSRQVYKQMNLGTGKDFEDYSINGKNIPYHLIDILEPTEEYNLFKFKQDFRTAFNEITNRNKHPLLVGGTGLYIHSILKNYQLPEANIDKNKIKHYRQLSLKELKSKLLKIKPELHNTTDMLIKERVINAIIVAESKTILHKSPQNISSLTFGIKAERDVIKNRITARLKKRLNNGMVEEVQSLIDSGVTTERLKLFGLEYKFIAMYLSGELNYNDMFQKLNSAIHKFAKRQMTWFRKMEKEGVEIIWIANDELNSAISIIKSKMDL